jgi:hypothetical protein
MLFGFSRRLFSVSILALLLTAQLGCLGLSATQSNPINQSLQPPDIFDGDVEILPGDLFGIELVSAGDQAINLGASKQITFAVQAASDLPSAIVINFDIARTELDNLLQVDTEVGTSLSVPSVTLAAGEQSVQTVILSTSTHAPSGFLEHFHIEANSGATLLELSVNLSVNPVFLVSINNLITPANWVGLPAGSTAQFRSHVGGLRVEFVNNSGQQHWTHADIPQGSNITGCAHQSTNGFASGTPPGGMYVLTLNSASPNATCGVYRHGSGANGANATNNEGQANTRTIMINVP